MLNNSSKILFLFILLLGTSITISSNSWISAWIGLEINLISFIPIISNRNNIFTTEASLKYFLIQTLASVRLLFLVLRKRFLENLFSLNYSSTIDIILIAPLLIKRGIPPFHWWFPGVIEGLRWNNCFILITIQKLAPLSLISHFLIISTTTFIIIVISITLGAIGGYNQISIRKILTYSSINHIGWIMARISIGNNYWWIYFSVYTLLTLTIIWIIKPFQISTINQILSILKNNLIIKFLMFSTFLSLGGLPPFLGFLPKWIIIQLLTQNERYFLISLIVVFSLITLYYYLRISYSSFLVLNPELNWNTETKYNFINIIIRFSIISLLGILLCTYLINII